MIRMHPFLKERIRIFLFFDDLLFPEKSVKYGQIMRLIT